MNKQSERDDIEHYLSTAGLMDVLEISRCLPAYGQGTAKYQGWKRSPISYRPSFEVVKGELP
jgi:hypothetical protein